MAGVGARFCREGSVSTCNAARTVVRKTTLQIAFAAIAGWNSGRRYQHPSLPRRSHRPNQLRRYLPSSRALHRIEGHRGRRMTRTGGCQAWAHHRRGSAVSGSGSCSVFSGSACCSVSDWRSSRVPGPVRIGWRISPPRPRNGRQRQRGSDGRRSPPELVTATNRQMKRPFRVIAKGAFDIPEVGDGRRKGAGSLPADTDPFAALQGRLLDQSQKEMRLQVSILARPYNAQRLQRRPYSVSPAGAAP